jgi:hypothetical protein
MENMGKSERVTWNFADFDKSTQISSPGKAESSLSKHYMDQWRPGTQAEHLTSPFRQPRWRSGRSKR